MADLGSTDNAVRTERVIQATPARVFAAFAAAEVLAQWWGPDGFTNTFDEFDFQPGGQWVFTMHGPEGGHYANEAIFREITPDSRIVIEHVVAPWYQLSVSLTATGESTRLTWVQAFESEAMAAKMAPLCLRANEQVLDRLQCVVESPAA